MDQNNIALLSEMISDAVYDVIGRDVFYEQFPTGYPMADYTAGNVTIAEILDNLVLPKDTTTEMIMDALIRNLYNTNTGGGNTLKISSMPLADVAACQKRDIMNCGEQQVDVALTHAILDYMFAYEANLSIPVEEDFRKAYEDGGIDAVWTLANEKGIRSQGYCPACACDMPEHNGDCLGCGTTIAVHPDDMVPDTMISVTCGGQPILTLDSSVKRVTDAIDALGSDTEAVSDNLGVSVSYLAEVLAKLPWAIKEASRSDVDSMLQEKEIVIGILQSFAKIAGNPKRQYLMEQAARELEGLDSEDLLNHFKSQGE